MYAVIQLGSKQYTVKRGDVVDIDLLPDSGEEGIEFTDVIFLRNGEEVLIGTPTLSQYVVRGQLLETTYGDKIQSVKYKRRKNQRRKFGHRQRYSRVKIDEIALRQSEERPS